KIVGSIPYHLSTQIIKKVVFESHASANGSFLDFNTTNL
ncbi:rRNA adenine N-6-methyltransferase family protein, partial [Lactobacillus crispatus]